MTTLIVKAKGDVAIRKLHNIALSKEFYGKSSIRIKPAKWFQYLPRIEVHFHDLSVREVSALKVKLAFVPDVRKVRELEA